MKITGLDMLRLSLRTLQTRVINASFTATDAAAKDLKTLVETRVTMPFQSVPSYIYETEILGRHGGPGKYAPDEIGHFARRAPTIAATQWEGRVQLYSDEYANSHPLVDNLRSFTALTPSGPIGQVGYSDGLPDDAERQLIWVMYGTRKMQPRPFLIVALTDYGTQYLALITTAVQQAWTP